MESAYHWLFLTALCVLAPCLLLALVLSLSLCVIPAAAESAAPEAKDPSYSSTA